MKTAYGNLTGIPDSKEINTVLEVQKVNTFHYNTHHNCMKSFLFCFPSL